MIARAAQSVLLIEFLAYGAAGLWLMSSGWSPMRIFAMLLSVAVGLRVLVTAVPFLVVMGCRLRDGRSLLPLQFGCAFVKEAWAKSASFTVVQPFERWLMAPDSVPAGSPHVPVLLVHGYLCNRGIWRTMRSLLTARLPNPLYTISLEPPLGSIDDYVPQLASRVKKICIDSGQPSVHLVCHSLGGLVARAWLARGNGAARVASVTTVGTPHHGTAIARLGLGHNASQMRQGSEWLQRLAADEKAKFRNAPFVSIYTENDNLVYPPESAVLSGAANIRMQCVGHVSLQFSAAVAAKVATAIQAAELARVSSSG